MSTTAKVAGFIVALAAAFGLAFGAGQWFGPDVESEKSASHEAGPNEATASEEAPGGLMISQDGYTLALDHSDTNPGKNVPIQFTIAGPDGKPITKYDVAHEKKLHMIAVRRDFNGFQHVHPLMAADGTWSTNLDLDAGQWRIFADFKATGADALTLGADLSVAGQVNHRDHVTEQRTDEVDGYTVTLSGDLKAGADAKLTVDITLDGKPVTDLQPYLGAYGHLVALRSGDLAYLHVHAEGGRKPVFHAAVPSGGTYHLYLDFKHNGVVRTAAFIVDASGSAAAPTGGHGEGEEGGHGGH